MRTKKTPKSWRGVTLKQFIALQELPETDNKITKLIGQVAVLTNSTQDEIRELTPKKLERLALRLSFIEHLPKQEKIKYFYFKRKLYKREKLDYTTSNQVTDILQMNADEENVGKKILNVLAVLYYTGKETDYDADRFNNMRDQLEGLDFYTALNSASFFLRGLRTYLPDALGRYFRKLTTSQREILINEDANIGTFYGLNVYENYTSGTTS